MSATIRPEDLTDSIKEILSEYGDVVYRATDEALDSGAKVLRDELRAASPKKTGNFKKNWRIKKGKMARYVGNTTTVLAKGGKETALINILEYSAKRGRPFARQTYEKSINKIAEAVVTKLKGEI